MNNSGLATRRGPVLAEVIGLRYTAQEDFQRKSGVGVRSCLLPPVGCDICIKPPPRARGAQSAPMHARLMPRKHAPATGAGVRSCLLPPLTETAPQAVSAEIQVRWGQFFRHHHRSKQDLVDANGFISKVVGPCTRPASAQTLPIWLTAVVLRPQSSWTSLGQPT